MPKLIKFYEDHADQRDKFEIIAFHDASAKTIEEIDQKLKEKDVFDKHWDGKNLPFPVLLDATGATIKGWGIGLFPTIVLIDPGGRIVRTIGSWETVQEVFERHIAGGKP